MRPFHLALFSFVVWLVWLSPQPIDFGGSSLASEAAAAPSTQSKLPDEVTLTADQLKDRDIVVDPAPAGTAGAVIKAPATAQFDLHLVTKIGPKLAAKVMTVTKNIGDRVNAGESIAILESVELGKVKAQYLSARARFQLARENYERKKLLADQKIVSQAEFQKTRAEFQQASTEQEAAVEELRVYGLSKADISAIRPDADAPFSRFALTTPQAGIIEKLDITPGQALTPQMTPIEVVDSSRMRILADAFERDVTRIKPGQRIVFVPDAVSSAQFSGKVQSVASALSPTTRTIEVRANVLNPDGILRAGMFGTARITTSEASQHALVPADAVQTVSGKSVVFKPAKGHLGRFSVAVVKTGNNVDGQVEILGGLSPGEPVVTHGAFALMSILTAGTRKDTD